MQKKTKTNKTIKLSKAGLKIAIKKVLPKVKRAVKSILPKQINVNLQKREAVLSY